MLKPKQILGTYDGREVKVLADGEPLPLPTDTDGYKWGGVCADAEALALAVLLRFAPMDEALCLRGRFLREVILMQPWPDPLHLLGVHLEEWVERQRKIAGQALVGAGA